LPEKKINFNNDEENKFTSLISINSNETEKKIILDKDINKKNENYYDFPKQMRNRNFIDVKSKTLDEIINDTDKINKGDSNESLIKIEKNNFSSDLHSDLIIKDSSNKNKQNENKLDDSLCSIMKMDNFHSSIDFIQTKQSNLDKKLLDYRFISDSPLCNFIETKNLNEIGDLKNRKKIKKINSESNLRRVTINEKKDKTESVNLNISNNMINCEKISKKLNSKKNLSKLQGNSYFNQYIISNNNLNNNKRNKNLKNHKELNNEMKDYFTNKTVVNKNNS